MDAATLKALPTTTLLKLVLGARLKALFWPMLPTFSPSGSYLMGLSRSGYNYSADVGDGLLSSVVMPVIQFVQRSFPEAPLVVRRRSRDTLELVDNHPMVQLCDRPNPAYPGTLLWMVTVSDWCSFGESYWRILRSNGGRPGELWWMAPWSVEPKWPDDGSVFISHYEYSPDGKNKIRLDLEEVLHFRHGLDPRNPRHGLPPLRAVLQDIWTDDESSRFVGAMLRNMGVPGIILSPKGDDRLSGEEVERVKTYIQSRFTGEQRGQPLALGAPTDVQQLSFTPQQLDLTTLRNTAEERVCAALGIPAAVVGFGTGLANSKVGATMHEFVRLAWNNGLVPMQRLLAAELQRILLPQFELNPDQFLTGWNYDEVQALEPDQNELATRYIGLVAGGILKVSEAREALGYESTPEDEIYLRPSSLTPIDPDDQMPEPEPTPLALPAANGNGNGNAARNGNGNGVVATRAALKQGGTLEDLIHGLIQRHARRVEKPPQALVRLANRILKQEHAAQARWQALLIPAFANYSAMVGIAAREVLVPKKQDLADIINSSIILERLPLVAVRAELAEIYAKLYEEMVTLTIEAMRVALNAEPTDPARIQNQVRMMARERVALLDLSNEARTAILKSLEQARLDGLDEDGMIRLLSDRVPAGRWTSVEMRTQVIARSESRFSSNLAASEYARQIGAQLLTLDARLGPTDSLCEERNGWVVTPSEASVLSGLEHANGTLALVPINQTLIESVGATP